MVLTGEIKQCKRNTPEQKRWKGKFLFLIIAMHEKQSRNEMNLTIIWFGERLISPISLSLLFSLPSSGVCCRNKSNSTGKHRVGVKKTEILRRKWSLAKKKKILILNLKGREIKRIRSTIYTSKTKLKKKQLQKIHFFGSGGRDTQAWGICPGSVLVISVWGHILNPGTLDYRARALFTMPSSCPWKIYPWEYEKFSSMH